MANIDFYFNEVEQTLRDASTNPAIQSGVKGKAPSTMQDYLDNIREVQYFLNDLTIFRPDIDDIIIVGADGKAYDSANKSVRPTYDFSQAAWFPDLSHVTDQIVFVGPHMQDYYYDHQAMSTQTVSAVSPIWDLRKSKYQIGAVIVNINMSKISSILERLEITPAPRIFILDNQYDLVYANTNDSEFPSSNQFLQQLNTSYASGYLMEGTGANQQLLVYSHSKINNWSIVLGIPISEVTKKISQFRWILVLIFIIFVPIVWFIVYFISSRITFPIKKLMSQMVGIEKLIEHSKLVGRNMPRSYYEIDVLSQHFNKMVYKINSLIDETYRLELEQKDSELRALQARINPHFLYNSLQAIKSLAMLGRNTEVSRVVTSLGHLFRYTIGKEDYMVSVQEELTHLRHYMDIQIQLLSQNCEFDIEMDERLHNCKVPRLSIQPIVENSFFHAFHQMDRKYRVRITGHVQGDQAVIDIWDNGSGIEADRLAHLLASLEAATGDQGNHIALVNVHRRLKHKFGKAYGLSLDSRAGEWTNVRLTLPFRDNHDQ
ncbi:histidine kinase [Paenibacillus sp. KQZ6P-2]|uniref:Histidine kinase n=2 Tax=Paenibacillus mangrovi TaxID=2931978 RepID=A0A9X1WSX5_9BACL|nr:histidine kinase [Paenibacillus mangrovi]